MPICASPDATFDFYLKSDADKPESDRPTFICRFRTVRDWHKAQADLLAAKNEPDNEKCFLGIAAVIASGVTGLRNMPAYRDVAHAVEFLQDTELWELAWGPLTAQRLTETERKNWLLQRASGPAPSATDATPANVLTNPAPPAPSLTINADSAPATIPIVNGAAAPAS